MDKDLIKRMLVEFQKGRPLKTVERELKLPLELFSGNIRKAVIITGPRRAGKTYYLYQLAASLTGKNVLYFDFEDERIIKPKPEDLTLILECYFELYPETKIDGLFVFLDEVENVEGWEKFVHRILERGARVFITGSSSKLLAKEISTAMRGRSVSFRLDPLSFREFLRIKGVSTEPNAVIYGEARFKALKMLEEYMMWGGFPEIALVEEERLKKFILQEYLLTMMHRDVEERYKVENRGALENLIKFLVTNISTTVSFNQIEQWMNSIGIRVSRSTLIEYSGYLESAFSFSFADKFNYSVKKQLRSLPKVYASDVGLHTANAFKYSKDLGRIAENIVYNHLVNSGKDVYYDANGYECDFVVKQGERIVDAIQVCWKLDEENKAREIKGLVSSMKKFRLKEGIVVNSDQKKEEEVEGMKIKYVPMIEFLLG